MVQIGEPDGPSWLDSIELVHSVLARYEVGDLKDGWGSDIRGGDRILGNICARGDGCGWRNFLRTERGSSENLF